MIVLVVALVLAFLAGLALELAYGATARRRQLRVERDKPARLEGGRSHLRD